MRSGGVCTVGCRSDAVCSDVRCGARRGVGSRVRELDKVRDISCDW